MRLPCWGFAQRDVQGRVGSENGTMGIEPPILTPKNEGGWHPREQDSPQWLAALLAVQL
jgi:hypothetical protein